MSRIHAFEIHELRGCPDLVRRLATDYLHSVGEAFKAFEPMAPLLSAALAASEQRTVVDLCSGGTGPIVSLAEAVRRESGVEPELVLTDLFPNRAAFERAAARASVPVRGETEPVDARAVPERLGGVRTVFDAFHHFRPDDARGILSDAAKQRRPILIVEATERSAPAIIGMLLFVPLLVLVLTPFVRPFALWRLLFTYVVPIAVPLILWDGIVSCLRSYTPDELREFTRGLETDGYRFHIGRKKTRGGRLTYVLGCAGDVPAAALA